MSERMWTPESYLDEVTPAPRATASDWIVGRRGDAFLLADIEGDDKLSASDADAPYRLTASEGDVIDFCWFEDLGSFEVLINADGTFHCDVQLPKGTHYCADHDIDTLGDSIEDFAKQYSKTYGCGEALVDVAVYTWSEKIPHRLVVTDGVAKFVDVAGETLQ